MSSSDPATSSPAAPSGFDDLELVEDLAPVFHFLATSQAHGRKVSLWRALPEAFPDARARARFSAAVEAAMKVGSAQVSPPLSLVSAADGSSWLCAELFSGLTLEDLLATRGKLEVDDVVHLALALCEALAAAHDAGAVHHGLRPSAVQVSADLAPHAVRLKDFGLGFLPGRGSTLGPNGVPLLAPAYAAPECIQGVEPSPASDLYALGALLYTALTGAPPFGSTDAEEVLHAHVVREVPALREGQDLSPAIRSCLEKDPARRPQSAREVAAMLGKANETLVPPTPRATGRISYSSLPAVSQARPGDEQEGDTLGAYKLVRLLGEGAMGRVFQAQHQLLGRQVALKILRPEQYRNAELIQRFFQEARTVNQINHQHIVEIIDFVIEPPAAAAGKEDPSAVYCVMELLEGQTLTQAMAQAPVGVRRAAGIMAQVCGALIAAHRVGVVHRDVKPDNIFLITRDGVKDYAKVLDFGVAKLTAAQQDAPLVSTMDGALIGTPVCMSPEQAAGQPVDHRSDIYAAGVVLYELLSGALPFNGATFGALAVQIITQPPPPLPAATRGGEPIPDGLRQLVMRCLEKKAEARPQSMRELQEALEAVARGEALLPAESDVRAVRRSRGPVVAAGAVAALALLGAGAWLWSGGGEKGDQPPRPGPGQPWVATVTPPEVAPVAAADAATPEDSADAAEGAQGAPDGSAAAGPDAGAALEGAPDASAAAGPDAGGVGVAAPDGPVVAPPPKKLLAKLGPEDVAQVVSRHQVQVQACVARHRAALKGQESKVTVKLRVEPTGKVSRAEVTTAPLAGTPFGQCVVKEVKRFAFPRFKGKAATFNIPFHWNLSE